MIILAILVFGMSAGWAASILLQRRTSPAQYLIVGLVGSLVGGTMANLISGDGFDLGLAGLLGSIIGAVVVLLAWGVVAKEA